MLQNSDTSEWINDVLYCLCGWRLELDKLDNRVVAVHYKSARVSPRMQLFHDVVSLRLVHAFSALYK